MSKTITLDIRSLKALAAQARLSILKNLGKRRYTVSELAKILDLKIPTVKEHLQQLLKADLVEKHDEGHKWKYYSLTKTGKSIVTPEEKGFILLFTSMLLSAVGAGYAIWQSFSNNAMNLAPKAQAFAGEGVEDAMIMAAPEPAMQVAQSDNTLCFAIFFGILFVLLLAYYLRVKGFSLLKKNV